MTVSLYSMNLKGSLAIVEERIQGACLRSGRNRNSVTVIAVTKTHPSEVIKAAYDIGLRDFGENRVQELIKKKDELPPDIHWHLIGQLQSNKAKYIAPFVHLVHSIDSISTAKELSRRAEQHDRTIDTLIEVNVAAEESKSGIASTEVLRFLDEIQKEAPNLVVKGLMTVAPHYDDPTLARPHFKALRLLAETHNLGELSMGMSGDFEIAIEEGATMVRVGSALFGDRNTDR